MMKGESSGPRPLYEPTMLAVGAEMRTEQPETGGTIA
jgi:hypothetical protein